MSDLKEFQDYVETCVYLLNFILEWYPDFLKDVNHVIESFNQTEKHQEIQNMIDSVMGKSYSIIHELGTYWLRASENCTSCRISYYCEKCMHEYKSKITKKLDEKKIECSLEKVSNKKFLAKWDHNTLQIYEWRLLYADIGEWVRII